MLPKYLNAYTTIISVFISLHLLYVLFVMLCYKTTKYLQVPFARASSHNSDWNCNSFLINNGQRLNESTDCETFMIPVFLTITRFIHFVSDDIRQFTVSSVALKTFPFYSYISHRVQYCTCESLSLSSFYQKVHLAVLLPVRSSKWENTKGEKSFSSL